MDFELEICSHKPRLCFHATHILGTFLDPLIVVCYRLKAIKYVSCVEAKPRLVTISPTPRTLGWIYLLVSRAHLDSILSEIRCQLHQWRSSQKYKGAFYLEIFKYNSQNRDDKMPRLSKPFQPSVTLNAMSIKKECLQDQEVEEAVSFNSLVILTSG